MRKRVSHLPEAHFSDHGSIRYMHLGTDWVQGSMRINDPYGIHLEYVQRMMAGLLFTPLDEVPSQHAMQLGLGAAALTKFCHKHLHTRTTAIELNPQVIAACRLWFRLPADTARLSVILGDAVEVAHHPHCMVAMTSLSVVPALTRFSPTQEMTLLMLAIAPMPSTRHTVSTGSTTKAISV